MNSSKKMERWCSSNLRAARHFILPVNSQSTICFSTQTWQASSPWACLFSHCGLQESPDLLVRWHTPRPFPHASEQEYFSSPVWPSELPWRWLRLRDNGRPQGTKIVSRWWEFYIFFLLFSQLSVWARLILPEVLAQWHRVGQRL